MVKEKAKEVVEEKVVEKVEQPKEKFNLEEVLNNPLAQSLFGGCKDLFKKKEVDPNVCEISIKAPSEVILKLFKVE